jgi:glycosyltransferase involved in cell wall biosynthesis
MRILVLQESDWLEKGPHQQHHLMERLAKKGHEIRVIDFEIDWRKSKLIKAVQWRFTKTAREKTIKDIKITVVRPSFIRAPYLDVLSESLSHAAEIEWQVSRFRPDVVVSLGIINAYVGSKICKRAGIPHIYYLIDSLETLIQNPAFRGFARGLISSTLKNSTSIFVINAELGRYAIKLGADPSKITLLGAGVDTARINPSVNGSSTRASLGIKPDDFVMFFMGWLYPFSGLMEVAEALAETDDPHLHLLILGRGELSENLERLKKDRLKDKITIVPWKPYEEIPFYLASSDVCLLPSYKNEVMRNIVPIKMYEYLAAGKPVIASALPGLHAEFGENSGVVYIETSKDAVDMAIELSHDPDRIKHLSSQALAFVSDRSWEKLTSKFETVLLEKSMKIAIEARN